MSIKLSTKIVKFLASWVGGFKPQSEAINTTYDKMCKILENLVFSYKY